MKVCIISRGRGPDRQLTYEAIRNVGYPVEIICHPEDKVLWPDWAAVPFPHNYPAQVRQHCVDSNSGKILILDDDFGNWSYWRGGTKWTKATPEEIFLGFHAVSVYLNDYPVVGIGQRLYANHREQLSVNGRVNGAMAIDTDKVKELGIKFRLKLMEDFDYTLQLLTRGIKTLTYSKLVYEQGGSNTSGGCSIFRSRAVQEEAAYELQRNFPAFVSLVTKRTKYSWGGEERTDVKCQWKAAFKSSQR